MRTVYGWLLVKDKTYGINNSGIDWRAVEKALDMKSELNPSVEADNAF